MVCAPAVTVKFAVWYGLYGAGGVTRPPGRRLTSTSISWSASGITGAGRPGTRGCTCRRAGRRIGSCSRCPGGRRPGCRRGALGLPEVNVLPLLLIPAAPENCQDEPLGGMKGIRGQLRHLETAVAESVHHAAAGQAGGDARSQQLAAFEALEIQPTTNNRSPCLSTRLRCEDTASFSRIDRNIALSPNKELRTDARPNPSHAAGMSPRVRDILDLARLAQSQAGEKSIWICRSGIRLEGCFASSSRGGTIFAGLLGEGPVPGLVPAASALPRPPSLNRRRREHDQIRPACQVILYLTGTLCGQEVARKPGTSATSQRQVRIFRRFKEQKAVQSPPGSKKTLLVSHAVSTTSGRSGRDRPTPRADRDRTRRASASRRWPPSAGC